MFRSYGICVSRVLLDLAKQKELKEEELLHVQKLQHVCIICAA